MEFNTHTVADLNGFQSHKVYDVQWNADGSHLGSLSCDRKENSIKIGEIQNGLMRCIHTVPYHVALGAMVWHPTEGGRFAFCSDDKAVEVWDVRSSRPAQKFTCQANNEKILWSPDGNYIVVANTADLLSVIDLRTGAAKKIRFPYLIGEMEFTANSNYILTTTYGGSKRDANCSVNLVPLFGDSSLKTIVEHSYTYHCLDVDRQCQRLALGSADHSVSLWTTDDMVCYKNILLDGEVRKLAFSGDGEHLAAATDSAIVIMQTGGDMAKVKAKIKPLPNRVNAFSWNPNTNRNPILAVAYGNHGSHPILPKLLTFTS